LVAVQAEGEAQESATFYALLVCLAGLWSPLALGVLLARGCLLAVWLQVVVVAVLAETPRLAVLFFLTGAAGALVVAPLAAIDLAEAAVALVAQALMEVLVVVLGVHPEQALAPQVVLVAGVIAKHLTLPWWLLNGVEAQGVELRGLLVAALLHVLRPAHVLFMAQVEVGRVVLMGREAPKQVAVLVIIQLQAAALVV
jgi:hypothetical protein